MYQRILVPINGGPTSERALQEAIKIAQGKAQIRLVYVLEEILPLAAEGIDLTNNAVIYENMRKMAQATLAQAAEKVRNSGAPVEISLIESLGQSVTDAINQEANDWGAEVMVIGTHGRSGLSRLLLGSVAEGIVRDSTIPVLLLRV